MSRVLLQGGTLVDPESGLYTTGDLLMQDGLIEAIVPGRLAPVPAGTEIVDGVAKLVVPGLVDLYTHLREPGREDQETLESGLQAALRGGFTAVTALPDTEPVLDHRGVIEEVLSRADALQQARVYPIGAITVGRQGATLTNFGELYEAGCVAFSDANRCVASALVMRRALEYAKAFQRPVVHFAEDASLAAGGVAHEGMTATRSGLRGIAAAAETTLVARDLELAALTGGWIHFSKLSAARSVELVRQAKQRGVAVTCGVSVAHLVWNETAIGDFNTCAKVRPPLRTEADRLALIEGLRDGTIDCIVSDHAPVTAWEKEADFDSAPAGMSVLETALALAVQALVPTKQLTWLQLINKWSTRPAALAGVAGGRLEEGAPADVAVIDTEQAWVVEPDAFASRGANTLLRGKSLTTRVERVYVDGRLVLGPTAPTREDA
jgi:dihydroorotase